MPLMNCSPKVQKPAARLNYFIEICKSLNNPRFLFLRLRRETFKPQ